MAASITVFLTDDPLIAERKALRAITDAFSLSKGWVGDGDIRAAIERDIRNVQAPAAFGLSEEFSRWESLAGAWIVWDVDEKGFFTVNY